MMKRNYLFNNDKKATSIDGWQENLADTGNSYPPLIWADVGYVLMWLNRGGTTWKWNLLRGLHFSWIWFIFGYTKKSHVFKMLFVNFVTTNFRSTKHDNEEFEGKSWTFNLGHALKPETKQNHWNKRKPLLSNNNLVCSGFTVKFQTEVWKILEFYSKARANKIIKFFFIIWLQIGKSCEMER